MQACDEVSLVHEKMKNVKLGHLSFYGFIQCPVTNYEDYSLIELVEEFCEVVPCFFDSYDHLHLLFKHRFAQCDTAMVYLRTDFLCHPIAPVQAKIARIIHMYFINLPWR